MYLTGFRFLAVKTGSMADTCPVGSLVITKKVDPQEINEGDIISFTIDDDLTIVTHRVVETDQETQSFITKGDANNTEDQSPVVWENLVGKVILTLPHIGYAVTWITSKTGRTIIMIILIAMIAEMIISRILEEKEETEEE